MESIRIMQTWLQTVSASYLLWILEKKNLCPPPLRFCFLIFTMKAGASVEGREHTSFIPPVCPRNPWFLHLSREEYFPSNSKKAGVLILPQLLVERASLVAQREKCLPSMQETWVQSLDQEDPLEKEMAMHSSILAWRIPWMEEAGRLQSMGSQRVIHDWATSLLLVKRSNVH